MGPRGLARLGALGLALLVAAACGDGGGGDPDGGAEDAGGPDATHGDGGPVDAASRDAGPRDAGPPETLGTEDRPAPIYAPPSYDPATPMPLLVLLHGFTANATLQNGYFGATAAAREHGFLLLLPNGTENRDGNRFWNATDACCDLYGSGVDDVAYLTGLIAEAKEHYNVDAGRVYTLGHSNGGFMSYRLACDASEQITAIASLAGGTWVDAADCGDPAEPVSVLQIHGTEDSTIPYDGGVTSVERFAERAGCDVSMATEAEPIDIETSIDGAETEVRQYTTGCVDGVDAELWSIVGGGHIPSLANDTTDRIWEWLSRHSRGGG